VIESSTPADLYNVKTIGVLGTSANIAQAISQRGWAVEVIHCVSPVSSPNACTLGDNVVVTALAQHLDTLVARARDLWVAPFGDVVRYIRERQSATVTQISSTATQRVYTLTDTLADSIYNRPLTLKTPLPSGWSRCTVAQATSTAEGTIVADTILFSAVPDGGDITLAKAELTAVRALLKPDDVRRFLAVHDGCVTLHLTTPARSILVELYSPSGALVLRREMHSVNRGVVKLPFRAIHCGQAMLVARVSIDGAETTSAIAAR
jgi:hypothetical protein